MISVAQDRLRSEAVRAAGGMLGWTTGSDSAYNEARRELSWWVKARADAARARTVCMFRGSSLAVSYSGYVELVPVDVPGPGSGQVTVRSEASAVNVGTERAQYLKLPNASRIEGGQPVGSLAGVVVAVGSNVGAIKVGERVAVRGAPHASVVTVGVDNVSPIPDGVSFADASLVRHAIIAEHGLRMGALSSGTVFGMVGLGIIGALTLRLAVAAGGDPRAVVATSRSKESIARASGATSFLVAAHDGPAIDALGLPVVFEVTGDPQALDTAVRMAGHKGRIVLLGSSRGVTEAMPVNQIRAKGLTLVGAHVDTMQRQSESVADSSSGSAEGLAAESFLAMVAAGRVSVADLFTRYVDPREAGIVYREMVQDRSIVGIAIDWTRLPDRDRVGRSSLLRMPSLRGRGVSYEERPVRRGRSSDIIGVPEHLDPFHDASGRLRIGMLGCGDISSHNAAAIAAAPNAELVACFDPLTELAREIADAYGAEQTASAEHLVHHPRVDAVFICVPHHLHEPMALQAIAAGKHVIVEKPLATDLRSALSIVGAADRAGVALSTCFPQRYDAAVLVGRHLIDQGALGEVGGSLVRVLMDKPPAYWFGGYSSRAHSTWRLSRAKAGGGVLIMNVCHYLDMIRHLAGVEVVGVSSQASTTEGDFDVEDAISVAMRYTNGAIGSVVASSTVRGTTSTEVQLWGREGHLVIEPRPRFFSLRRTGETRTSRWQHLDGLPSINGRAAYVTRLASAIDRGQTPDVSASDAVAVQALIEAAYRSSEVGQTVPLADLPGLEPVTAP
jgi:predicted dehydrogenase/threonine dehydrogenase-like Zn-dependent dehydrogenase